MTRPHRRASLALGGACLGAAAIAWTVAGALAFQNPQTGKPAPTFRARTDLVQLDISVLDKARRPVRGLTAADFIVLEDTKPQTVSIFEAIEVPGAVAPPVGWMRDVTPDTATNEGKVTRLWLLVVDDALVPTDPYAIKHSMQNVHELVDRFGPEDLVTIVFTADSRPAQDFTSDRTKLLVTLKDYNPGWIMDPASKDLFETGSLKTILGVIDTMSAVPHVRKALVWVSPGPFMPNLIVTPKRATGARGPEMAGQIGTARKVEIAHQIFEYARRANVPIFPLTPSAKNGMPSDLLITFANQTAGHAYVNVDAGEGPAMDRIFEENSAYYLVGYYPTNTKADGSYRRLDVKVKNRPDVEVRTRSSYYAPKPGDKPPATPNESLGRAAAHPVQVQDLAMHASAVPVAVSGEPGAAIAVVVSLPPPPGAVDTSARVTATTELRMTAVTTEGDKKASQVQTSTVALRGGSRAAGGYDVVGRLDLPPGRVRVRIAALQEEAGKVGTVMVDTIVPNFAKDAASMSGVAVGIIPERPVGSRETIASLLPIVPTARRDFRQSDVVAAVFYVYQQVRAEGLLPAEINIRVTDVKDIAVVSENHTIEAASFSAKQTPAAAPFQCRIPLDKLPPGPHLLTIEAKIGEMAIRRDVQFVVRNQP